MSNHESILELRNRLRAAGCIVSGRDVDALRIISLHLTTPSTNGPLPDLRKQGKDNVAATAHTEPARETQIARVLRVAMERLPNPGDQARVLDLFTKCEAGSVYAFFASYDHPHLDYDRGVLTRKQCSDPHAFPVRRDPNRDDRRYGPIAPSPVLPAPPPSSVRSSSPQPRCAIDIDQLTLMETLVLKRLLRLMPSVGDQCAIERSVFGDGQRTAAAQIAQRDSRFKLIDDGRRIRRVA